jgi:hypothetical protein
VDTPTPRIPLNLVEWLEERALLRAPDPDKSTEAELRTFAAEVRFVRFLRGEYNDQTNPSEDLP